MVSVFSVAKKVYTHHFRHSHLEMKTDPQLQCETNTPLFKEW
jgi:hypothetical protein